MPEAKKILVVDDQKGVREVLVDALQSEGYVVEAVSNGELALENIPAFQPDMMLLDLVMPGLGGEQVMAKVQSSHPGVLVIIVTAYGTIEDAVKFLKLGAVDYITKPFLLDEVTFKIGRAFREKETWFLSIIDRKTRIFNHAHFVGRLAEEILRARRYLRPLSLLMLDIDHFKNYNDNNGHLAGDEALKRIARILKDGCRETDMAARYGGEEFVVILPETDSKNAMATAERLRRTIEKVTFPGEEKQPEGNLTVCTGVASYDGGDLVETPPSDLVDKADKALYEAKRQGRNRVCFYKPNPAK